MRLVSISSLQQLFPLSPSKLLLFSSILAYAIPLTGPLPLDVQVGNGASHHPGALGKPSLPRTSVVVKSSQPVRLAKKGMAEYTARKFIVREKHC